MVGGGKKNQAANKDQLVDNDQLVDLEDAVQLVGSITVRQLRNNIARGQLAAVKVGRSLLVSVADVRALYQPTLRRKQTRVARPSPRQRAYEQLAAAGIVVERRGARS